MTLRLRITRWLARVRRMLRDPSGKHFAERTGVHLKSFDARYAEAREARRRGR